MKDLVSGDSLERENTKLNARLALRQRADLFKEPLLYFPSVYKLWP